MSSASATRGLPIHAPVSVAPMMDRTDRHCRYMMRRLAPGVGLYTEMVTADAILAGDRQRLLAFDDSEHPVAVQLGGSNPARLREAARIALGFGYDEINLNVGCPSDRVQSGRFGACLMLEPSLVAECVAAMAEVAPGRVTVKNRIGVDGRGDYDFLARFVETVSAAGCDAFAVHARIAVLSGLSPRQNREVPPLQYPLVWRLKNDFPRLHIVVNGGIDSLDAVREQLQHVDGVMVGRKAYAEPLFLARVQAGILDPGREAPAGGAGPHELVAEMARYATAQRPAGVRVHHVSRHLMGLFNGRPGARAWRRYLSEHGARAGAQPGLLLDALKLVE